MTSTQLPILRFPDDEDSFRFSVSFFPSTDASYDGRRFAVPDAVEPGRDVPVDADPLLSVAREPASTPISPNIPIHPIPLLQQAFTESLDEVTHATSTSKPKLALLDARARREKLLNQDKDAEPLDAAWRYRPGQSQHELLKLLAQISFGVYLLLNGIANSNTQVISILQGHIDEVDEYLEVTLQDLEQVTSDLNARIDHLKLPLSNIHVFEELLEDRAFRSGILEANEKIDHILCRTSAAMRQWHSDIEAGLLCTSAFNWLNDQNDAEWRSQRPDVTDVFDAMNGNAESWLLAFDEVQSRAQEVNKLLIRLTTVIDEMEKKAGEVSRRTWSKIPPFSLPAPDSRGDRSLPFQSSSLSGTRISYRQQPSIRSESSASATTATVAEAQTDIADRSTPLHPPPLRPLHHAPAGSVDSRRSKEHNPLQSTSSHSSARNSPRAPGHVEAASNASLYILQPRIYSPHPTEPPAQMCQEASTSLSKPESNMHVDSGPAEGKGGGRGSRSSLRQRVSLMSTIPDAIQIPPRSVADTTMPRPSSKYATPRSTVSQPFDSAYCSDADVYSIRQGSYGGSDLSLPSPVRPQLVHSPRSDHQQYYRPVQASPHSPLQQRPHTATGPRASQFGSHHLRKQPSQPGSMSTLSNVTVATYDTRAATPTAPPPGQTKRPKKKKSALGWFKKAFSLDEDERAEFQARRAMAQTDRYYESNSPKFLDGRRIR